MSDIFGWFNKDKCKHDWTAWSQLVSTYHGVNQFKYCKKCNIVKKLYYHSVKGAYGNDYNLLLWKNPKSEADKIKQEDKF